MSHWYTCITHASGASTTPMVFGYTNSTRYDLDSLIQCNAVDVGVWSHGCGFGAKIANYFAIRTCSHHQTDCRRAECASLRASASNLQLSAWLPCYSPSSSGTLFIFAIITASGIFVLNCPRSSSPLVRVIFHSSSPLRTNLATSLVYLCWPSWTLFN